MIIGWSFPRQNLKEIILYIQHRYKVLYHRNPEQVKIVHSAGYTGGSGGSVSLYELVLFLFVTVVIRNLTDSFDGRKKSIALHDVAQLHMKQQG